MDTWGFAIMGAFGLVWLIARKKHNGLATFSTLMFGIGAGIVIGAIGSYIMVSILF